jgi:hypothetical protein
MMQGPDLKAYEGLNEPKISFKPDTPVLEVPFNVSSEGLSKAFGVLMKTYFKLSGVRKGPGMPAPAARYTNTIDFNMESTQRKDAFKHVVWTGSAAIPVPATVRELPPNTGEPGLTPRLTVWHYGEVAEILHKGPYEDEPPIVQKLMAHIAASGYEIAGQHEEEYLRGPGMPFSKPANYVTIIRYPVKKKVAP